MAQGFGVAVPQDVRSKIGGSEVSKSLGTSSYHDAIGQARKVDQIECMLDQARSFASSGELCDLLGIGRSTGTTKGGEVSAALKMRPLECEWLHPDVLANDPRAWFLDIGGMVVDARQLPPGMQQQAFRLGPIPFVPSAPSWRANAMPSSRNTSDGGGDILAVRGDRPALRCRTPPA